MTEKRFTVVVYDDKAINGFAVLDLQKPNNTLRLKYESVYIGSKEGCEIVCGFGNSLAEENKELQVQCNLLREQSNEFHRGARENANGVGQLEKENKELKEENEQLKHDATVLICSNQEYRKKNEQLKKQLSEAKADEKQLGISFMGYKMKLIEVLRKKYDKVKGKTLYADVYTEIAEEMGVDLE